MLRASFIAAAAVRATLALGSSECQNPVTLHEYGSFCGTEIRSTLGGDDLPAPVDAWLGIDYATQPVGEKRFTEVGPPTAFDGIKQADKYGKFCVQDDFYAKGELQDEACLNFNVFRTKGVSASEKVPVLVWIHGGAFNSGGYTSFDGAAFAASSTEPIIVVNFHYRVNSLGFLPSALFEEEGLLNLGLRDQYLFLEFVQEHIASFGGDPDSVTIGGRSAGGHSTGIHYFHNYGENAGKPLFARAIHQSGSVTSRAFPNATYPLYVKHMETYMDYLGCPQDDNEAALRCLREVDVNDIRTITTEIYNKYDPQITWPFQPTQGGPLLEKFGSQSGQDGTFFHVPTITSTATDEGKSYVPGYLETNDDFLNFLHNTSPALNETDLELLEALYPDPATDPDSPFANSPNSTQFDRIAAAWSDYAYICPGQETAHIASSAGVPTWKLRFDTNNTWPAWKGIPHGADTKYAWNDPSVQYPEIGDIYHAYLASFVVSGDPNKHRYPGSPEWPTYQEGQDEPGSQLVVNQDDTRVELDNNRAEACLYWRSYERAPRLNK